MLFKRKPKPPLDDALRMVSEAIGVAYRYKRDKSYMPSEAELQQLDQLAQVLWESHCTVQYISRNLHQRFRGEPEGAKKFTVAEAADYHYPPRQLYKN